MRLLADSKTTGTVKCPQRRLHPSRWGQAGGGGSVTPRQQLKAAVTSETQRVTNSLPQLLVQLVLVGKPGAGRWSHAEVIDSGTGSSLGKQSPRIPPSPKEPLVAPGKEMKAQPGGPVGGSPASSAASACLSRSRSQTSAQSWTSRPTAALVSAAWISYHGQDEATHTDTLPVVKPQ